MNNDCRQRFCIFLAQKDKFFFYSDCLWKCGVNVTLMIWKCLLQYVIRVAEGFMRIIKLWFHNLFLYKVSETCYTPSFCVPCETKNKTKQNKTWVWGLKKQNKKKGISTSFYRYLLLEKKSILVKMLRKKDYSISNMKSGTV